MGLVPKFTCLLEIQARFPFFFLHKIKMSKQQICPLNHLLNIGLMLTFSRVLTFLSTLPLWEYWISWNISWISLKCRGNVNYYKSVHHPFSTRGNREHPDNFQNESVSSSFNWVSRYILFLAKLKGRGKSFLKGTRRGPYYETTPKSTCLSKELRKSLFLWNMK